MSFEIGENVLSSNCNYCLEVKDYVCTGNTPTISLINTTQGWKEIATILKLDNGKGIFNIGNIEIDDLIYLQFNCNDENVDTGSLTLNKDIILYKQ